MALQVNLRQKQILEGLYLASGWVTGKSLAASAKVSDRTIRGDMRILDKVLEDYNVHIEAISSKGYRLDEQGKEQLMTLMAGMVSTEEIPITPSERMMYYMSGLLFEESDIEVAYLEARIYISQSTIEKDLLYLQRWLDGFNIGLLRDKGRIRLIGSVIDRRYLMLYLLEHHDVSGLRMALHTKAQIIELYKQSDSYLKSFQGEAISNLSGEAYLRLRHVIVVLSYSLEIDKMGDHEASPKGQLPESVHEIAGMILGYFNSKNKSLEHSDVLWLLDALQRYVFLGRRINISLVDQSLQRHVQNALAQLGEAYGVVFLQDSVEEISKLVCRNIYDDRRLPFEMTKPKQSETMSPLAVEMTIELFRMMDDVYDMKHNGDDFNLISIIIATAIEKAVAKKEWEAKQVVIISEADRYVNEYLKARLVRFFPMLSILDVLPTHCFRPENYPEAEFILSTNTGLEAQLPILMIHPKLKDYDRLKIKAYLRDKDSMQHKFVNLFREVLYFKDVESKDAFEAIRRVSDMAQAAGYGDQSVLKETIERERIKSTAMGNGVAIPHAMSQSIHENVIVVAVLKNSISWGREKVRLIMMLHISEKHKNEMENIFGHLTALVQSKPQIDALIHANNYYEFMKILNQQTRRHDEL